MFIVYIGRIFTPGTCSITDEIKVEFISNFCPSKMKLNAPHSAVTPILAA